jgi:hypothetical protein
MLGTAGNFTVPLNPKLLKLNNFMFDSLCLMLSQLQFGFEINLNALANSPSLVQGLVDIMILNPEPERHSKHSGRKEEERNATERAKIDVWEVVLFLWMVYASHNSIKEDDEN